MHVSVWDLNTAAILPTVIIVTINLVNLAPFSTVVNLIYIHIYLPLLILLKILSKSYMHLLTTIYNSRGLNPRHLNTKQTLNHNSLHVYSFDICKHAYALRYKKNIPQGLSVLILPPLATILNEVLAREGRPLAADFSTVKGAGFRLNEEAITEAAICFAVLSCFVFVNFLGFFLL